MNLTHCFNIFFREAIEAFTGVLPFAYVASSCRCPPTHPKINVAQPAKCLKNKDGDVDTVSRLADTAHPIEFATDADPQSFWLSEITNSVTIDINLSYSGLQVIYVFSSFPNTEAPMKHDCTTSHTNISWSFLCQSKTTYGLPSFS